jgi:hypothetical protein
VSWGCRAKQRRQNQASPGGRGWKNARILLSTS